MWQHTRWILVQIFSMLQFTCILVNIAENIFKLSFTVYQGKERVLQKFHFNNFWRTSWFLWGHNRFLSFTSGATPADLLAASMWLSFFNPRTCIQVLVGFESGIRRACDKTDRMSYVGSGNTTSYISTILSFSITTDSFNCV